MLARWRWCLLVVATATGCQCGIGVDPFDSGVGGGSAAGGSAAPADAGTPEGQDGGSCGLACLPAERTTQGFNSDLTAMRYRLVAASADGQRIAVLYSHFGPSSQDPFTNLVGYQADRTTELFRVSRITFGGGLSEVALGELEAATLADPESTQMLTGHALKLFGRDDAGVWTSTRGVRWCSVNGGVCSVAGGAPTPRGLSFSFESVVCDNGVIRQWSLCAGARCVRGAFDCLSPVGDVGLVDVFELRGVYWAVAKQRVTALDPLTLEMLTASGARFE